MPDEKDLRIKELERQLEELDSSWKLAWAGLLSERDAALAQVVGLRNALEKTIRHLGFLDSPDIPSVPIYLREAKAFLSNTSATAQQVRAEIEREALEKAWIEVCAIGLENINDTEAFTRLRDKLAAILGEQK